MSSGPHPSSHLDLAQACFDSYGSPDWTPIIEGQTVQAYYDASRKLLVFAGSNDMQDWQRNADYNQIRGTHRGFTLAWDAIKLTVLEVVGSDRVTITGHSLGGALAQLAALELTRSRVVEVVTFGCPRVFNPVMAATYASQFSDITTRYVFIDDPVCHVPLPWQGFTHATMAKYLRWYPSSPWTKWRHSMQRYIRALS